MCHVSGVMCQVSGVGCIFQGIGPLEALWADAFYKSKCPCVCLFVRVFTFEVPFNGLFAPTSGCLPVPLTLKTPSMQQYCSRGEKREGEEGRGWGRARLDDDDEWGESEAALLCTPPGRRPGNAEGGERARPGGAHSIFLPIHDLHIWEISQGGE